MHLQIYKHQNYTIMSLLYDVLLEPLEVKKKLIPDMP